MSLSWGSKFQIFICILISLPASAAWFNAEGRQPYSRSISEAACFSAAFLAAKKDAMSKAGLERLASSQMEICSDTVENTICELHQQTLSYYDDGFIAGTEKISESREGKGYDEECVVRIKADVREFNSQPDANFALRAEIEGSRRKRHGERVSISGETNLTSDIKLLGWYPHSYGDYFSTIIPNIFENKFNDLNGIVGDFSLPSDNASKLYEITAQFPDGVELDEVTEVLIVLATKKRFDLLEKESAEEFHKRLDVLGRENWKMQKLGYSILKGK